MAPRKTQVALSSFLAIIRPDHATPRKPRVDSEARRRSKQATASEAEESKPSAECSAKIRALMEKGKMISKSSMIHAFERLQSNRGRNRIIRICLSDAPENYKKGRMEVIEKQLLKDFRWPVVFSRVVWTNKQIGEGIITARWRDKEVDPRIFGAARTLLFRYGLAPQLCEDGGVVYVLSPDKGDMRVFDHRAWILELQEEGIGSTRADADEMMLAVFLEKEFG